MSNNANNRATPGNGRGRGRGRRGQPPAAGAFRNWTHSDDLGQRAQDSQGGGGPPPSSSQLTPGPALPQDVKTGGPRAVPRRALRADAKQWRVVSQGGADDGSLNSLPDESAYLQAAQDDHLNDLVARLQALGVANTASVARPPASALVAATRAAQQQQPAPAPPADLVPVEDKKHAPQDTPIAKHGKRYCAKDLIVYPGVCKETCCCGDTLKHPVDIDCVVKGCRGQRRYATAGLLYNVSNDPKRRIEPLSTIKCPFKHPPVPENEVVLGMDPSAKLLEKLSNIYNPDGKLQFVTGGKPSHTHPMKMVGRRMAERHASSVVRGWDLKQKEWILDIGGSPKRHQHAKEAQVDYPLVHVIILPHNSIPMGHFPEGITWCRCDPLNCAHRPAIDCNDRPAVIIFSQSSYYFEERQVIAMVANTTRKACIAVSFKFIGIQGTLAFGDIVESSWRTVRAVHHLPWLDAKPRISVVMSIHGESAFTMPRNDWPHQPYFTHKLLEADYMLQRKGLDFFGALEGVPVSGSTYVTVHHLHDGKIDKPEVDRTFQYTTSPADLRTMPDGEYLGQQLAGKDVSRIYLIAGYAMFFGSDQVVVPIDCVGRVATWYMGKNRNDSAVKQNGLSYAKNVVEFVSRSASSVVSPSDVALTALYVDAWARELTLSDELRVALSTSTSDLNRRLMDAVRPKNPFRPMSLFVAFSSAMSVPYIRRKFLDKFAQFMHVFGRDPILMYQLFTLAPPNYWRFALVVLASKWLYENYNGIEILNMRNSWHLKPMSLFDSASRFISPYITMVTQRGSTARHALEGTLPPATLTAIVNPWRQWQALIVDVRAAVINTFNLMPIQLRNVLHVLTRYWRRRAIRYAIVFLFITWLTRRRRRPASLFHTLQQSWDSRRSKYGEGFLYESQMSIPAVDKDTNCKLKITGGETHKGTTHIAMCPPLSARRPGAFASSPNNLRIAVAHRLVNAPLQPVTAFDEVLRLSWISYASAYMPTMFIHKLKPAGWEDMYEAYSGAKRDQLATAERANLDSGVYEGVQQPGWFYKASAFVKAEISAMAHPESPGKLAEKAPRVVSSFSVNTMLATWRFNLPVQKYMATVFSAPWTTQRAAFKTFSGHVSYKELTAKYPPPSSFGSLRSLPVDSPGIMGSGLHPHHYGLVHTAMHAAGGYKVVEADVTNMDGSHRHPAQYIHKLLYDLLYSEDPTYQHYATLARHLRKFSSTAQGDPGSHFTAPDRLPSGATYTTSFNTLVVLLSNMFAHDFINGSSPPANTPWGWEQVSRRCSSDSSVLSAGDVLLVSDTTIDGFAAVVDAHPSLWCVPESVFPQLTKTLPHLQVCMGNGDDLLRYDQRPTGPRHIAILQSLGYATKVVYPDWATSTFCSSHLAPGLARVDSEMVPVYLPVRKLSRLERSAFILNPPKTMSDDLLVAAVATGLRKAEPHNPFAVAMADRLDRHHRHFRVTATALDYVRSKYRWLFDSNQSTPLNDCVVPLESFAMAYRIPLSSMSQAVHDIATLDVWTPATEMLGRLDFDTPSGDMVLHSSESNYLPLSHRNMADPYGKLRHRVFQSVCGAVEEAVIAKYAIWSYIIPTIEVALRICEEDVGAGCAHAAVHAVLFLLRVTNWPLAACFHVVWNFFASAPASVFHCLRRPKPVLANAQWNVLDAHANVSLVEKMPRKNQQQHKKNAPKPRQPKQVRQPRTARVKSKPRVQRPQVRFQRANDKLFESKTSPRPSANSYQTTTTLKRVNGGAQDIGMNQRGDRLHINIPAPFQIAAGSTNPKNVMWVPPPAGQTPSFGDFHTALDLSPHFLGSRVAVELSFAKRYCIRSISLRFSRVTGYNLSTTGGIVAIALTTDPGFDQYGASATRSFDGIRQQSNSIVFPVVNEGMDPVISASSRSDNTYFVFGDNDPNIEANMRQNIQYSLLGAGANLAPGTDASPTVIAYVTMQLVIDIYDFSNVINLISLGEIMKQEAKRRSHVTADPHPATLNPVSLFCVDPSNSRNALPLAINAATNALNVGNDSKFPITVATGANALDVKQQAGASFQIFPGIGVQFPITTSAPLPVTDPNQYVKLMGSDGTAITGIAGRLYVNSSANEAVRITASDGSAIQATGGQLSTRTVVDNASIRISATDGSSITTSAGSLNTNAQATIKDAITGGTLPLSGRNDGYGNGVLASTPMFYAPLSGSRSTMNLLYAAASTGPSNLNAGDGGPDRRVFATQLTGTSSLPRPDQYANPDVAAQWQGITHSIGADRLIDCPQTVVLASNVASPSSVSAIATAPPTTTSYGTFYDVKDEIIDFSVPSSNGFAALPYGKKIPVARLSSDIVPKNAVSFKLRAPTDGYDFEVYLNDSKQSLPIPVGCTPAEMARLAAIAATVSPGKTMRIVNFLSEYGNSSDYLIVARVGT